MARLNDLFQHGAQNRRLGVLCEATSSARNTGIFGGSALNTVIRAIFRPNPRIDGIDGFSIGTHSSRPPRRTPNVRIPCKSRTIALSRYPQQCFASWLPPPPKCRRVSKLSDQTPAIPTRLAPSAKSNHRTSIHPIHPHTSRMQSSMFLFPCSPTD